MSQIAVGINTASISRNAGGLFESVRGLASGLKNIGCAVTIFSTVDEFSFQDLHYWKKHDVLLSKYYGPNNFRFSPRLISNIWSKNIDILHTHGIWMYNSYAAMRWNSCFKKPILVSPRGMLDSWALNQSKIKKYIAKKLIENKHLERCSILHALCLSELKEIRKFGYKNPIALVPNGVDLFDHPKNFIKPDCLPALPNESKVLLYLGRIHKKKGLEKLITAWIIALNSNPSISEAWYLIIAGWGDFSYLSKLKKMATCLNINNKILFVGPQFGEIKHQLYSTSDAFVLPSFSEGLPVAVLEAWSHRLPVLMTKHCNIPEGFASSSAIEISHDINDIAEKISFLFSMNDKERNKIGNNGRNLVERSFTWEIISKKMDDAYNWILGGGTLPSHIISD